MSEFSVIIPTLQRAKELHELVEMCAAHPRVLEVLVINNAPEPLAWESPKVRVLQQEENVYVNPAWNLGAREARGKYLAIVNDDVLFDGDLLDQAARLLNRPWVGMVGIDVHYRGRRKVRPAGPAHTSLGYGVFMAMRSKDYVPIPGDMLIWGGDDFLFWTQRRPPVVLMGVRLDTDMSTTSASPEFQQMRLDEIAATERHLAGVIGQRWWHRPATALAFARKARGRVGSMLRAG